MIESRFSVALAASVVLAAFAGAPATAADAVAVKGSADAGATKAAVCTACHGVNGNSVNPEWPNLAGQNAAYIREQLAMFKAKKRNNPIMAPISPNSSPRRRPPVSRRIRRTGRRARRCTSRAMPRATSRPVPPVTVRRARAMRVRDIRHFARSIRSTPSSSCRITSRRIATVMPATPTPSTRRATAP
jgi:cytochrome c551/c552